MCEALIHFTDQLPSTDPNYALRYLAFDIIVVCDDAWPWTEAELTNPNWRVLKVPGVAASFGAQFAAPRYDAAGNLIRKRDYCIDSTQVPSTVLAFVQNNQVITLTAAQAQKVFTWVKKRSTVLTAP